MPVARLLLVEDHEPFRQFVRLLLQQRPEYEVVGESWDGLDGVRQAGTLQPDVILLDIGLPFLSGIEVAKRASRRAPRAKLIFLSQDGSPDVVREAFRWGADAYVHKLRVVTDLLPAIAAVLRGESFLTRDLAPLADDPPRSRHEVQLYKRDAVCVEAFGRFIADALRAGHPSVLMATEAHRDAVAVWLNDRGIDIHAASRRGLYTVLDAAAMLSTIMVDGAPDRGRFLDGLLALIDSVITAAECEASRVAIAGECVALLCAEDKLDEALSLERAGHDLILRRNVEILCAYPLQMLPDDESIDRISAVHTAAFCG